MRISQAVCGSTAERDVPSSTRAQQFRTASALRLHDSHMGAVMDRNTLVFVLKVLLVLGITLHFALTRDRPIAPLIGRLVERHTFTAVLAGPIAGSNLLAILTTSPIDFGAGRLGLGYGHDGEIYGWMTEHFAWFRHRTAGPFAHRFIPPMLVHYSGLDTFTGFRVLNLGSYILASLLVYRVARDLPLSRMGAVVSVVLFETLNFGLKFLVYYPVLTDGLGQLLLMTVVWTTLTHRYVLYILAMAAAVSTRENLLILMFFNVLYVIRTGGRRRIVLATLLQVLPLILFALSRAHPVFQPDGEATWLVAGRAAKRFLMDPEQQTRFVLADLNSLGLLVVLTAYSWRKVWTSSRRSYEWAYFAAASLGIAVIGGADFDRFAVWLAPCLIFSLLAVSFPLEGGASRLWIYWLVLQAVAMEFFLPWSGRSTILPCAIRKPRCGSRLCVRRIVFLASGRSGERDDPCEP